MFDLGNNEILICLAMCVVIAGIGVFLIHRIQLRRLEDQRGRDQFQASLLNVIVHDIMNPILAARFSLENLKRSTHESSHKYVDKSLGAIEELNKLVQRVRDLRALETGRKRLQFCSERVNEILTNVEETFQDRVKAKGIALVVRQAPTDLKFDVDPIIFQSNVLNNLVDNSIKFTRTGNSITIEANRKNGQVEFIVSDQGMGMEKRLVDTLFLGLQKNIREDLSRESGMGIGMMQVNTYLRMANGEVEIESRPESQFPETHGTTVKIRLPMQQPGS